MAKRNWRIDDVIQMLRYTFGVLLDISENQNSKKIDEAIEQVSGIIESLEKIK